MKYGSIAVIGVIILLIGFSMPSTETITSESCTEGVNFGDSRIGGGCVESQTEVPNTTRGPVIFVGFALALVGGTMALLDDGDSKEGNRNLADVPVKDGSTQESNSSINNVGSNTTKIRITAKTRDPDTGETATSELTIETTDINEAKNQFLQHCNQDGIEVVSELQTEIID